jgi:hypothetical protein
VSIEEIRALVFAYARLQALDDGLGALIESKQLQQQAALTLC